MSLQAASAVCSSTAATAATMSPMKRTFCPTRFMIYLSVRYPPIVWRSGPSSPVTTQTTPGSFSASEVSMLFIMPCGMGLPSILP